MEILQDQRSEAAINAFTEAANLVCAKAEAFERQVHLVSLAIRASNGSREEVSAIAEGVRRGDTLGAEHEEAVRSLDRNFPTYRDSPAFMSVMAHLEHKFLGRIHGEAYRRVLAAYHGNVERAVKAWSHGERHPGVPA